MSAQKPTEKTGTSGATATTSTAQQQSNKEIPSLGALDEDDEFEEFEAQGDLGLLERRVVRRGAWMAVRGGGPVKKGAWMAVRRDVSCSGGGIACQTLVRE